MSLRDYTNEQLQDELMRRSDRAWRSEKDARRSLVDANPWRPVTPSQPPDGVVVQVANNGGAKLKRSGNLWFSPDGSVYVYYTPTLWREMV